MEIFKKNRLYAKLKKCEFFKKQIKYLRYIVSKNSITVDIKKTDTIKNWLQPTNIFELRLFLGLIVYYRKFIEQYSKIVASLTELLKKDNSYEWKEEQ